MGTATTIVTALRAAEDALTRVLVEHGAAKRKISEQTIAEVRVARNMIAELDVG